MHSGAAARDGKLIYYIMTSYTAPKYAENLMEDKMGAKNSAYGDMVTAKDSFFGVFYGKVANMFSGATISDINEGTPSSTSYKGTTSTYANGNDISKTDGYQDLLKTNDAVQTKRLKMDADISRLNSSRNINNKNDPGILYNAHFFVNLLWIILATSLIYYIFTEI